MKETSNRVDQILKVLTKYIQKDFSVAVPVSGEDDELDAIAVGLNTMVEELQAYVEERKVHEEEIKRLSEERTRLILENALDAVITIDSGSAIIGWNIQAERMFGWKAKDALKRKLDIIIPERYRKAHHQGMKHFLKTGEGPLLSKRIEITAIRKSGDEFPIELTVTCIQTPEGLTFNAFVRDITERKKAETELRESEERLRMVLQNMPVMLNAFDENGKIVVWNRECEEVTGYEAEDIIGNPKVMEWLYPNSRYRHNMMEEWNRLSDDYYDWEMELQHKDGSVKTILWSNISKRFPVSGWATWGVGVDITERKKVNETIKQLNQELKRRVKERTLQLEATNKELESFTYSVSHDLRAPLRAVGGYAQILKEDYEATLDDEGKRIITTIKNNVAKMGILIDDLLAFSRMGRIDIRKGEIDMNELVKKAAAEVSNSIMHNAKIKTGKLHKVKADKELLYQVIFNLISNALKYSSKKESPVVEIFSQKKNSKIIFSVKDNGVGFNMKYVDKLFEVFQRLHSQKEFEGTGVGLAIVYRVITKHGGQVWAEGKVNKGAVFSFSLPIS